jgi:hypothetical protein
MAIQNNLDDATVVLPRTRPSSVPRVLRVFAWIQFAGGVAMLLVAAFLAWQTHDFASRAAETDAEVIRLLEHRDGSGPLYTPVFAFQTAQGQRIEVTHSASSNPPSWRPGQRLRLLYDPDKPERASPADGLSLWLLVIVFGGFGVGMLVLGAVFRVLSPDRRHHLH